MKDGTSKHVDTYTYPARDRSIATIVASLPAFGVVLLIALVAVCNK